MRIFLKVNILLLCILLGSFVFPLFEFELFEATVTLFDITLGLVFIWWLIRGLVSGKLTLLRSEILLFILLVFGWGVLSIAWARNPIHVLTESTQWVEMLFLVILISSLIKSEKDLNNVISFFIVLVLLDQFIALGRVSRILVSKGYARNLVRDVTIRSSFFSSVGLIWIGSIFPTLSKKKKKLFILLAFLFGGLLLISLTRKSWVGVGLALLTIIWLQKRNVIVFLGKLIVLVILILLMVGLLILTIQPIKEVLLERFKSLTFSEDTLRHSWGRVYRIETNLNLFSEYPILGVGLDNIQDVDLLEYAPKNRISRYGIGRGSHNSILKALVEIGAVGTFLYLLMLAQPYRLIGYWKRYSQKLNYSWILMFSIGVWIFALSLALFRSSGIDRRFFIFFSLALTIVYQKLLSRKKVKAR